MRDRIIGYWTLSWIGLIANIVALPIITLVIIYKPLLKVADMTLAISLGWPAAIIGIVSSSALLAERKWGVILALISLSMVIAGALPYSIVRLINLKDYTDIGGLTLMISICNVLALIYWCLPNHRKSIRL
tara:strand:- start:233 stop:625 length:393 start_codon:yes stop_codon:yes gene_type:complete